MAPKKGGTQPSLAQLEVIEEIPDSIPRDQWKRPLIKQTDGTKDRAYTRASTLGKALEDDYNLTMWKMRVVAFGMSRRSELVATAASIADMESRDNKKLLDEIAEKAKEAGGGDRGANVGTALHKLSERHDAGEDLTYLPDILYRAVQAYARLMENFEVLSTETFVVCDHLEVAGTFDRVVRLKRDIIGVQVKDGKKNEIRLKAGTILVLDLKTGALKSAAYWGPTYGVQQTVYAHGVPYDFQRGRLEWEDILGEGNVPSLDWALIMHVPGDSPEDAGFVLVDLEDGMRMAELAVTLRNERKCKSLLTDVWIDEDVIVKLPDTGVDTTDPSADAPDLSRDDKNFVKESILGAIAVAENKDVIRHIWESMKDAWTDEFKQAARARVDELEAKPKPEQVAKADLMGKLRVAKSNAEMKALYHEHQDVWTDDHLKMVKARLVELGEAG